MMLQLDDDNKGDGVAKALLDALARALEERDRLAGECLKYQRRIRTLEHSLAERGVSE